MTLTELYETYETKLRRYATRLTGNALRADDLVQETFIRAMDHLAVLSGLKSYQQRAWMYRTLKNLFIDQERTYKRQQALFEQLVEEFPLAGITAASGLSVNPFELVPERYRDLVEKRYVLGMTSREIGAELGIPAATVRSRLHLAMKAMRKQAHKLF